MIGGRRTTRRVSAMKRIGAALTSVVLALTVIGGSPAQAADLSKFQPGSIISDAVFFNSGTMSEGQIQSFLESKVPRCEPGYTCLKDWYDTSRVTTADAMCGAYPGGMRERASAIVYKVAQACGINPQVLLVILQKEQGLVTHVWPSDWRYTIAMGQGCPDTAACDTRYYGFFNQVFGAAWQLKRYANPPGTSQYFTWYAPGKTWNIRYNPNVDCGSSPVLVQNQATANLYYYTPYQPNAAALRAGYGEGDGCSAYGNRNFYQYFTDWFGSTQRDPVSRDRQRICRPGRRGRTRCADHRRHPALPERWRIRPRICQRVHLLDGMRSARRRSGSDRCATTTSARNGADGDMGWPALNAQTMSTPTGDGTGQVFTGGSLYSGAKGTFIVREPLRQGYFA